MTPDECLSLAWTYCAPNRAKFTDADFARGFWPDVARVAMAMFAQQTGTPSLDFRPTMCQRGNAPEPRVVSSKVSKNLGLDLGKLEINL
jgi:hypothetical protein